jgi:hypothetical protein
MSPPASVVRRCVVASVTQIAQDQSARLRLLAPCSRPWTRAGKCLCVHGILPMRPCRHGRRVNAYHRKYGYSWPFIAFTMEENIPLGAPLVGGFRWWYSDATVALTSS